MKWVVAGIGLVVLVALLVLGLAPDSLRVATPASTARTAPAPALPPVAPVPAASPAVSNLALRGAMVQPGQPDASIALLSVDGAAARAFRPGDVVSGSMRLASVAADHVIVVQDGLSSRVDLSEEARASAGTSPAAMGTPAASHPQSLPGLSPGAPPDENALAASRLQNRKFLEDRAKRRAQAGAS